MSKRKPIGRLIGASPIVDGEVRSSGVFNLGSLGGDGEPTLWTPSNLTDTPYLWVDGDQGITNLGDGGSITVTTGWTNTSTQNGLGTVGNTTNTGRFNFPQSSSINTTFALVKGDSGWTTRGYATMFSGINGISGEDPYQCLGGNTTGVIDDQFTTVETWRHTRENGTQINWVSGDWGTKTTDWELYVFQSSVSDPWLIEQFGNDRTVTNRHFSGHIAEILALEEELSLTDIEKIEGYLMHKWGLEANLPAGHTYKSAAPAQVLGRSHPTRKWGGITGRSITTSDAASLENTGVMTLAEHYQVQLFINRPVVATGGTYVEHNGYSYNVFYFDTSSTTPQTLTIPTNLTQSVDVLMVAGGGGGGWSIAAGGGAGGMVDTTLSGLAAGSYTITVGGGGAGGVAGGGGGGSAGSNGANTTFTGGSLSLPTANGGGGGGSWNAVSGTAGGSGGGGVNGGAGTSNQTGTNTFGNNGSAGTGNITTGPWSSGSGGGAGGAAPAAVAGTATNGGVGRAISWIPTSLNTALTTAIGEESGGSVYFAGGGGATDAANTVGGTGGVGGGGTGGGGGINVGPATNAEDGQAHTGGGGGGGDAGFRTPLPGDGGSGIVVIRYTN